MRTFLSSLFLILLSWTSFAQVDSSAIVASHRPDGLFSSTRGAVQNWFASTSPALKFDPSMNHEEFLDWQWKMQAAMASLMKHPCLERQEPKMVKSVQRDGYRVEKWESYPLPGSVVAFLVLVPDGVDASHPAEASFLCIPGFGQTKELVAGEKGGVYDLSAEPLENVPLSAMAKHYVEEGWVAVAVDNPSFGELADNGKSDYLNSSRILLEGGWSYLGYSSYCDKVVLDWMKTRPYLRNDRIVVSGFSLGTEPMMAIGLMDKDIYAFVYNDFLCNTRERILVMTKPDSKGERPFPNSIEHLIPEFLSYFDFPDIVAAFAPRPVICVEGGMDRDFNLIKKAYEIAGAPSAFTCYHYDKYADPSSRTYYDELPEGLDRTEYFELVNCDSPRHGFKKDYVLPWLRGLFPKKAQ